MDGGEHFFWFAVLACPWLKHKIKFCSCADSWTWVQSWEYADAPIVCRLENGAGWLQWFSAVMIWQEHHSITGIRHQIVSVRGHCVKGRGNTESFRSGDLNSTLPWLFHGWIIQEKKQKHSRGKYHFYLHLQGVDFTVKLQSGSPSNTTRQRKHFPKLEFA